MDTKSLFSPITVKEKLDNILTVGLQPISESTPQIPQSLSKSDNNIDPKQENSFYLNSTQSYLAESLTKINSAIDEVINSASSEAQTEFIDISKSFYYNLNSPGEYDPLGVSVLASSGRNIIDEGKNLKVLTLPDLMITKSNIEINKNSVDNTWQPYVQSKSSPIENITKHSFGLFKTYSEGINGLINMVHDRVDYNYKNELGPFVEQLFSSSTDFKSLSTTLSSIGSLILNSKYTLYSSLDSYYEKLILNNIDLRVTDLNRKNYDANLLYVDKHLSNLDTVYNLLVRTSSPKLIKTFDLAYGTVADALDNIEADFLSRYNSTYAANELRIVYLPTILEGGTQLNLGKVLKNLSNLSLNETNIESLKKYIN